MRMCALRSRRLPDCDPKGCSWLRAWLHPKCCIPTGVDADGRRAPGRLFLRNVIEDHLVAVRRRIERVFHLVDAEGALVRVVARRRDDGYVVVVMGEALVLVRGLPGTDDGKFTMTRAPWLDEVRQVLGR